MERIDGTILKDALSSVALKEAGRMVGHLHNAGIVHGDLTTSNMIIKNDRCYLIDFGLGYNSTEIEARGVDIPCPVPGA